MKKYLLLLLLPLMVACGEAETPEEKAKRETELKGARARITEAIKEEKSATGFEYTDDHVLRIFAKDDGTSRDGYAEYYCSFKGDLKMEIDHVEVVDDADKKTVLGTSDCVFPKQ